MEVGGWVKVSLGIFFCGKSSQNIPIKPVLIFWSSIPCVFCLQEYALLKAVSYYDFSVRSMSVMGFQKKCGWGGWVGGVSSIEFFLGSLEFFNFAKPLRLGTCHGTDFVQ